MTVGELRERLESQPDDKPVCLYDADGDPDEVVDIDSYEDAVVLVSMVSSREGGTR